MTSLGTAHNGSCPQGHCHLISQEMRALVLVTSLRTGHNGTCHQEHPQAVSAPLLLDLGNWQVVMQGEGWAGWGTRVMPKGVSNPEGELSAQRDFEDVLGALSSLFPPTLMSPLSFHLLQAMSLLVTLFLLLLAVQPVLKQDPPKDVAIARKMLEREVYLRQEMIRLLQEIEESAEEDMLLSTLQWQCLFWTALAALVLITVVCWTARVFHEPPQLFTAHCSGLPRDVSEFEIKLIIGEEKSSGS